MADLSKIVCLEQDCRHGTEQTGGSGSGNDTYTKAEIDSKDADIRAAASEAKSVANNAQSVNQTQDGQIKALQRAVDNLHNYEHPAYSANQLGFYKFANDAIGSVSDAQPVTKKDITDLGIPDNEKLDGKQDKLTAGDNITIQDNTISSENTRYKFSVDGTGLEINQSTSANFSRINFPSTRSITPLIPYFLNSYDDGRGFCWCQLAFTVKESGAYDYKKIGIEGGYEQGERIYYHPQGVAKIAIALYGDSDRRGVSITADLPLHNGKLFEVRPLENLNIFSSAPEKKLSVYAVGRFSGTDSASGGITHEYDLYLFLYADKKYTATNPGVKVTVETLVYPFDGKCANVNRNYSNVVQLDSSAISESIRMSAAKVEAVTDVLASKADKSEIPDISGKQDKSTAVTHTTNTAVGSTAKPVYIAANGAATPISHSINADVPSNAKFTDTVYTHPTTAGNKHIPAGGSSGQILRWSADGTAVWGADNNTTYSDATQSAHGLMTAADKKKLDGIAAGATKVAVDSALSATSTNPVQNKVVQAALNGKAASGHTHAMITNSAVWIAGANNAVKWYRLGVLVSSGNFSSAVIRVWSGDGANGRANQNSFFEIQIKDGWQSTESAAKACGVTVYRTHCDKVKVKVIPTAHDTYTVWAYLPWTYWNGNYAVYGKYKSWTSQQLIQSDEPEGTGADTAYYDQAFLTSTVAKSNEATTLTETAWTDVPETNISPRYGKNIKYLKSGNTVYVRGSISFSASLNNPCCGTMPSELLPDDYQDHVFTAWNLKGGVPTAYPVVLGTDGKIILMNPTSTANWFVAGRAYNFNFNYHIG